MERVVKAIIGGIVVVLGHGPDCGHCAGRGAVRAKLPVPQVLVAVLDQLRQKANEPATPK